MLGVQDLRTNRVKLVLEIAAGIGEREGTGHLVDKKKKIGKN